MSEHIKRALISALETMLNPEYKPADETYGICGNIKHILEAQGGYRATSYKALGRLAQVLAKYGKVNKVDHLYPIENGVKEYFDNKEKWKGEWRMKRLRLAGKTLKFLLSGDATNLEGLV